MAGHFFGLSKRLVEWVRGKRFDRSIGKVGEMLKISRGITKDKVNKCQLQERVWEVYKREKREINWICCCVVAREGFR